MLFRSVERCGVFAIEIRIVPAFGMAGQSESWKMQRRRAAPLDCNTSIRTHGVALFVLRVAIEGFKEKREVWFDLKKHLAVNCVGADVKDGVRGEVKRRELVIS